MFCYIALFTQLPANIL